MKKIIWKIYFIIACLVIIIGSIYQGSTLILSISSLCGVIYSLLVAKNVKWSLIFGIINVSSYGFILLDQNIFGGFIYNVLYSLPMLIYGFYNWNKSKDKEDSGIKYLSKEVKIIGTIFLMLAIYIYALVLSYLGGDNVILDSSTSVLGYVGIYLLTNKYVEQWNIWILSNLINLTLWIILTLEDLSNLPLALMWAIYFINSFYGYYLWNKKLKSNNGKCVIIRKSEL